VGREARVKQAKMPTICYLCGKEITDKKAGDLDHVPPQRIFAKSIRKEQPLQLSTVRVHKKCNQDYKPDEEYFFTALIGEAHSPAGHEAWKDLKETFKDPAHQGLLKQVLSEFGTIELSVGKIARFPQWTRLQRVSWKIVRGLYFIETGKVLPEQTPHLVDIYPPNRAPELPDYFQVVRDTESKAKYGAVFDYKSFAYGNENIKLRISALLLWDQIIILVPFHDPMTCECEQCVKLKGAA
jgi:hypothetical protein